MNQKTINASTLMEISLIRPFLIILLLAYHSFAPWCGAQWPLLEGMHQNNFYWWIGKFSYSFMLPLFVFVSGYVWSYQQENRMKLDDFHPLVKKKIKRLYLPCLLFGSIYVLLFNFPGDINIRILTQKIVNVFEGYAHFWFLPMLLWCFVVSWFVIRIKNIVVRCICVLALFGVGVIHLPIQLNQAGYYLSFFIIGYYVYKHREFIVQHISPFRVILLWGVWVLLFVSATLFLESFIRQIDAIHGLTKFFLLELAQSIRYAYSVVGLFAVFFSALLFKKYFTISDRIIEFGKLCFGVYVFQQFILMILYYHTPLYSVLGEITPWISLLITLVLSSSLTLMVRKTKVGRNIL